MIIFVQVLILLFIIVKEQFALGRTQEVWDEVDKLNGKIQDLRVQSRNNELEIKMLKNEASFILIDSLKSVKTK